jgi:ribonuclease Z
MSIRPAGAPETGRLAAERKDLFHRAHTNPDSQDLLLLSPSILEKFAETRTKVDELALTKASQISKGADIGVIPLGTASAVPTSSRNGAIYIHRPAVSFVTHTAVVSSTLVRIPSRGSILLDAGEGTYGQLARHFGPGLGDVLRDLRCIFVSHIHGDHHMGVAKILAERRQVCVHPSILFGSS